MDGVKPKTSVVDNNDPTDADAEKQDKIVVQDDRVKDEIDNMDLDGRIPGKVFGKAPASFVNICRDIKRIILLDHGLDLGSMFNLILIWEDMAYVFWQFVERRFVKINISNDYVGWRYLSIYNTEDLEHAGVLASGGHITLDYLSIVGADVSRIPDNIVNNLVKIVKEEICLQNITGWRTSMVNDVKCKELRIRNMRLESGSDMRPFIVSDAVALHEVSGDIHGFLDNFDVDQKKSFLSLQWIDVSTLPNDLLNRFFKSFNCELCLRHLTGFSSSMLNGVNCRKLNVRPDFHAVLDSKNRKDMIIRKLDTVLTGDISGIFDNIKSCEEWTTDDYQIASSNLTGMVEMLNSKVMVLRIRDGSYYPYLEFLSQYNGQGKCGEIIVERIDFDETEFKSLRSWANAREWKFKSNGRDVHLKRPQ